jgi:hypothetical protein
MKWGEKILAAQFSCSFDMHQNNVKFSNLQLSADMLPHVTPGHKISEVIVFHAQNILNLPSHLFILRTARNL